MSVQIYPALPDHANLDRSEWRISPSQMDDFASCQRKWAWAKIAGIQKGDSASAALGNRVHKILEDYLSKGFLPDQSTDEGQIATSGLHLLPQPMAESLEVEKKWTFSSPRGNHYTGRKDYAYVDVNGIWVVGDHKTTSDFKWAQTSETLGSNIQAVTYAAEAMLHYDVDRVGLEWTYYRTRGSRTSRQVRIYMTAPEVEAAFISIDGIADSIHDVRKRISPGAILDLPANIDTCEKYGGCPYRSRCNMTPAQRTQAIMNAGTQSLLLQLQAKAADAGAPAAAPEPTLMERLASMQQAPAVAPTGFPPPLVQPQMAAPQAFAPAAPLPFPPPVAAPPQAPAPTLAPLAAPPQANGAALVSQMVANAGAPYAAAFPQPPAGPTPVAGTWYADGQGLPIYPCQCGLQISAGIVQQNGGKCPGCQTPVPGAAIFANVNPPESTLPAAPPVNPAAVAAAQAVPLSLPQAPLPPSGIPGGLPLPASLQVQPVIGAQPIAPPVVVAAPAAPVAGRKGRPPGAKNKPKAGQEAPTPAATPGQGGIATLYVNCIPQGGCDTADTFLFAPARKRFAEAFPQTPDYRMMDYGKGVGLFSALVAEYLTAHDVGDIYVDSRSVDAMNTMSVLVAAADHVVRGVQ